MENRSKSNILTVMGRNPLSAKQSQRQRRRLRFDKENFRVNLKRSRWVDIGQVARRLSLFCVFCWVDEGFPVPDDGIVEEQLANELGVLVVSSNCIEWRGKVSSLVYEMIVDLLNDDLEQQLDVFKAFKLFQTSYLCFTQLLKLFEENHQVFQNQIEYAIKSEARDSKCLENFLWWIYDLRNRQDVKREFLKCIDTSELIQWKCLFIPDIPQKHLLTLLFRRTHIEHMDTWVKMGLKTYLDPSLFEATVKQFWYVDAMQFHTLGFFLASVISLPRFSGFLGTMKSAVFDLFRGSIDRLDANGFRNALQMISTLLFNLSTENYSRLFEKWLIGSMKKLEQKLYSGSYMAFVLSELSHFALSNTILGHAINQAMLPFTEKVISQPSESLEKFLNDLPLRLEHLDALSMTTHMNNFSSLLVHFENDRESVCLKLLTTFAACCHAISVRTDLGEKTDLFLYSWSILFVKAIAEVDALMNDLQIVVGSMLELLHEMSMGRIFVLSYFMGILEVVRSEDCEISHLIKKVSLRSNGISAFLEFVSSFLNVTFTLCEFVSTEPSDSSNETGVIPLAWLADLNYILRRDEYIPMSANCRRVIEDLRYFAQINQNVLDRNVYISKEKWIDYELGLSEVNCCSTEHFAYELYVKSVGESLGNNFFYAMVIEVLSNDGDTTVPSNGVRFCTYLRNSWTRENLIEFFSTAIEQVSIPSLTFRVRFQRIAKILSIFQLLIEDKILFEELEEKTGFISQLMGNNLLELYELPHTVICSMARLLIGHDDLFFKPLFKCHNCFSQQCNISNAIANDDIESAMSFFSNGPQTESLLISIYIKCTWLSLKNPLEAECLANAIITFIISDTMKKYRGLTVKLALRGCCSPNVTQKRFCELLLRGLCENGQFTVLLHEISTLLESDEELLSTEPLFDRGILDKSKIFYFLLDTIKTQSAHLKFCYSDIASAILLMNCLTDLSELLPSHSSVHLDDLIQTACSSLFSGLYQSIPNLKDCVTKRQYDLICSAWYKSTFKSG